MFSINKVTDRINSSYDNGIWKGQVEPLKEEFFGLRNILLERLRKFPNRIGQIDSLTGDKDTYGHMADRAVRCALWLKSQNLKSGDIIGICTYNHLNTFVPLVASLFVGAIANPWWDSTLDNDLASHFLHLTKPTIVFADDKTIHIVDKAVKEVQADVKIIALKDTPGFETLTEILSKQDPNEVAKFRCKDLNDMYEPAIIAYTSGTTGSPKGALHSYGWLTRFISPVDDPPSINFWGSGICWISGLMNTLANIALCSTAVVYPNPTEEIMCHLIEKYKINRNLAMNTATATRLWRLEAIKKYDLSSLKWILVGGSGMLPEVDEFLVNYFPDALIIQGYGSTEVGATCLRVDWTGKPCSCGPVVTNCQIKIVDLDSGQTLGPNQEGEIYFKHPYAMLGYYNNEEETKKILDNEGWLHSGDVGYYDSDGEFFIVDRHKELIKFRHGTHVSPKEIEAVILQHPDIFEVGVVARPHLEDIEQPVAFVSRRRKTNVTEKDIIDLVAQRLPDHMHVRGGVVILEELPHTNSGKISKKQLRQMARLV